jgi:hypothetical protein
VDRHCFASHVACGCELHVILERFHGEGSPLPGPCRDCGGKRVLHPLYTYHEVPGRALAGCLDRSLAELGVGLAPSVLVRGPRGSTLMHSAAEQSSAQLDLVSTASPVPSDQTPSQEVSSQ